MASAQRPTVSTVVQLAGLTTPATAGEPTAVMFTELRTAIWKEDQAPPANSRFCWPRRRSRWPNRAPAHVTGRRARFRQLTDSGTNPVLVPKSNPIPGNPLGIRG